MQPYQVVNYIISTGEIGYPAVKGDQGIQGPQGEKGDTGDAAGFGTPTATVGTSTGTPSVTVTASGSDTSKVFSFQFDGLKGDPGVSIESITEQASSLDGGANIVTVHLSDGSTHDVTVHNGSKGSTGDAAGFGTPTATVGSSVGTPSVSVTATGPDTDKVFSFEFENLKGDKGDKGDPLTIEDFLPIEAGMVYPYAGSVAPTGYLLCDGAAYLRSEYPELFSAIGTTYGPGDGSTTFNVPDYRGRTLIGSSASHVLGATGGEETHVLTPAETAAKDHSHTMNHGHGFTQPTVNGGATTTGDYTISGSATFADNTMTNTATADMWKSTSGVFSIGSASGNRAWANSNVGSGNTKRVLNLSAKHSHSQVAHTHSVTGGKVSDMSGSTGGQTEANGSAHNNMQPYAVANYIISTGSQYIGFKGAKGDTGDSAGFGTVSATVDANVGTPSVTVTATGPDTAKEFSFAFSNLKGETGAQGPQGAQGPKGDTGDMATGFYVGAAQPAADSTYFFWYNPTNGAVKMKQYVEPDAYTDGGWAWRELVFADTGKNGDVYTATADTPSS